MQIDFNRSVDWLAFYQAALGISPTKKKDSEWAEASCILPTHPHVEKRQSTAAINIYSGNYKCWSGTCQNAYQDHFNSDTEVLSPRRVLSLVLDIDLAEAQERIDAYLESVPDRDYEDYSDQPLVHPDLTQFVIDAQNNLKPDLPVVVEYCETRGITYETLELVGAGYVFGSDDPKSPQEECLILPYYINDRVVGVRGRTIDGRKGGVKKSLYTLYLVDDLRRKSGTCVICEGESDTLALRQILPDHIPVVGTPGAQFRREWVRYFGSFSRVLLVPQDDEAAAKWTSRIQKFLGPRCEAIQLPWTWGSFGKDVCDFIRQGPAAQEELLALLSLEDYVEKPYIVDAIDLLPLTKKPIPWVIPGLIERNTKTLLVGDPKTFKTWIALQMALSVTQRQPFLDMPNWIPERNGTVILVEEEGSDYRLADRLQHLSLSSTGLKVIHRQGVLLDDTTSLAKLRLNISKIRPDLIILDPYASLHLQDENTVQGTMKVVNAINSIMRACPTSAVVIVHHTPKGGAGPRGSGALWGACDMQIQVERDEDGVLKMQLLGRDLPDVHESFGNFTFDEEACRVVPQLANIEVGNKTSRMEQEVLAYIGGIWLNINEIADGVGRTPRTLKPLLEDLVERKLLERTGAGKKLEPFLYRKGGIYGE